MLKKNLALYFVTPEIGEDTETWELLVRQAVIGGATIIQIRDKICSAQKMMAMARKIHPFLKKRGVPLLINDRVDIAHAIGADGVLNSSIIRVQIWTGLLFCSYEIERMGKKARSELPDGMAMV
jgi:hypothetical protein